MKKLLAAAGLLLVLASPAIAAPTGTIEIDQGAPAWGEAITFASTVAGEVKRKASVDVAVVCVQDGRVVYQWSANPDSAFPLVQQDGLAALGFVIDTEEPGDCTGTLVWRLRRHGEDEIVFLDEVAFTVSPV